MTRITEPDNGPSVGKVLRPSLEQRVAQRVRDLHAADEDAEVERQARILYNDDKEAEKRARRAGGQA